MVLIALLHTGDLHGRLSREAAGRIREMKREAGASLLLDAGDAVSAGNIGVRWRGEEILRRMTDSGYDALAMGNREFHFCLPLLRRKLGEAAFPILCANLRGPRAMPVESHRVFEVGGVRVAVFGLCAPMIRAGDWARRISPFVFDEPIEVAAALVPTLRREADAVVAVTHLGLAADRRLSASVSGIDLILGGHSHTPLDAPEGAPAILHTAPFGREIGRAVLEIGGGETRLVSWEKIPLDGGRAGD